MFIYYCNSEWEHTILNMVGWERLSTIVILNMVGWNVYLLL